MTQSPGQAPVAGETLIDVALAMPARVFATVDGAQFDDASAVFAAAGFKAHSLFLGAADAESEKAGPWLVDIDTQAALTRFIELLADKPAAVLWSCPTGEATLYRHLRTLNEAIVPLLRAEAEARQRHADRRGEVITFTEADYRSSRVLFRHWDPRVLAQVLPTLDESQFARVLGPAALVVMPREDGGRPFQAHAPELAAIAPQGPLRLNVAQMEAISETRVMQSRRRMANYLREVAPNECGKMDDRELSKFVVYSEGAARGFGVESERATTIWTYMMATSKTDISKDWRVQRLMAVRDPMTPDERVHHLFDARLRAL